MRKIAFLLLLFVSAGFGAFSQKTITGKVTDEKGGALEGVSIVASDGKTGTKTDASGAYSITVGASIRNLTFSYVDYGSVTRSVTGSVSVINVQLQPSKGDLEEVVVVGYGTQQKRKVTAAISRIGGSEISNLASTSFEKQLGGRAAGVQVVNNSGLVSAPPTIRIRGTNSLTQGRDPLFVIDGVPTFNGGASGVANTNVLADINPDDIESVEVLKDGAASAIYGSRAANGVVLITTKKGKSGKLSLNYNSYIGFSKAFNKPDLLSATEFVTVANEKLTNAGLAAAANMNSENTNTNWLDNVFNSSPFVQSHTLSVSGGNEKSTYYMSLNYLAQDGIIRTNTNNRWNIRGNMEHRINKFVKIGNNITLSRTEDNDQNNGGNALSGAMGAAMRALPNVRIFNSAHPTGYNITAANDALGNDANTRVIENNYSNIAYVLDKNRFNNERFRIINNFFLEIAPIKSLTIRSQASYDYITAMDFQSLDRVHGDGRSSGGSLFQQNIQATIQTWQNYATYTRSIKKHAFSVVGGVEMQRIVNRSFNGQGTSISDPFFASDNLITNTYVNQFSGGGLTKRGFQSYFGRVNYDYSNRYFAQFSIRRDGLSSLAEANRYGNFYGGSLGWKVSEETFWKNLNINHIISDLKIRGSYAEVGNQLAAAFPFLSTYGARPYGGISGNAANNIGNSDLQWETNKKLDYGIDMGFLNNRINLTVDYFINKNDGQVLDVPQPVSFGIPNNTIAKNIGTMENKGIEITVSGDVLRKKDFTWNVSVNYTNQSNKIIALAEGQTEVPIAGPNNGTFNVWRIGEGVNALFGYNYAGVNSANGNPMWFKQDGSLVQYNNVSGAGAGYFGVVKPGDPTLGPATTLGNRYIIGNPLPTYYGGITNTLSYKGLSLEIFLRFSGGNDVYNLTRQEVWNSLGFVNNGREVLDRWKTAGQVTDVPKLYYGRDNQVNLQGQANSRFLESGDFMRLQNLVLAYQFGGSKLEKWTNGFVKSARFFAQGQNLAVWSKYTGIDPENFTELGIDNSSVPQLRTFTMGMNIGF